MQPEEQNTFNAPPASTPTALGAVATDNLVDNEAQQPPSNEAVTWQASEYIQHDKSGLWFLGVAGIALALLLIDFFLIKSWTFGALIVVMAVVTIIFARRPPRIVSYVLTPQSLQVDEKTFHIQDFRAFGVMQEDAVQYIHLLPVKRFMPAVNVYFPPEYGEQIVDILGSLLPMETIEPDFIDRLTQKIRF